MKQKAVLIKDFYNDKGALHVGDKVVIDGLAAEGFTRVITDTGAIYVIPSHIIKKNFLTITLFLRNLLI